MRLKWLFVTILCATLLHSAIVVRAEHEDAVDEEEVGEAAAQDVAEVSEDLMDATIHEDHQDPPPEPPAEDSEAHQEPAEEPLEDTEVEAIEPHAADPSTDDVEVDSVPKISGRRSGNYYFDDDYYNGNYDVDLNYNWGKCVDRGWG